MRMHPSDLDYATSVEAARYVKSPRSLTLLLLVLAAMFGMGLFWASRAMVDEVTRADGRVVPSGKTQVIQSLEGGLLKEILVSQGSSVEIGTLLLRIDDTRFSAELGELDARKRALSGRMARLVAETQNADKVDFDEEYVRENASIVTEELNLFNSRRQARKGQADVLQSRLRQREQELNEAQVGERRAARNASLARQELNAKADLARDGIIAKTEVLSLRREVNALQGEVDTLKAAQDRINSAIDEARQQIVEQLLTFQAQAQGELIESQSELAVIEESMRPADDRQKRTDVRSPVRGTINTINVNTIGGVIQPGQTLIEIVPLDSKLQIEARVRPSDVAFISLDQRAIIKLTAYDFAIYGGLDGLVSLIGVDSVVDEVTGERYFPITVETTDRFLKGSETQLPIIPGMVGTVDILTGEKSILNYILKPIRRAKDEALRER